MHLADHEIEAGSQYKIPVHLQPPYRGEYERGDFPKAEEWANTLVTLPCHQHMNNMQVNQVIDAVKEYFE